MPRVTARWTGTCAAILMAISSCTPSNEDSASMDCSKLNDTFFVKNASEQEADFADLDVETKYTVYICGSQKRHPPAIALAVLFAQEGDAAVGFLKDKLAAARGDGTIRDILNVFEFMSRQNTYNVAADAELMEVIENSLLRIQDSPLLAGCERSLRTIRQQGITEESGT